MSNAKFYDDYTSRPHLNNCLKPLLKALGWKGDEAFLFESMPHMVSIENVEKFSFVMKNIGYSTKMISIKLEEISEMNFPCLFIPDGQFAPVVVFEKSTDGLSVFDSETQEKKIISNLDIKGTVLYFKKKRDEIIKEDYRNWFGDTIFDCKGMIFLLMTISFIQALLMLTAPAYIMFLYDNVINTKSYGMLFSFSMIMLFVLYSLYVLLNYRSRILGYFGSRLQNNIGVIIFSRLLKLQASYIESAPLSRQLIRLNDFNYLREFFGGPLISTVFELPFVFILFLFIWIFGGKLVVVPLLAGLVYFAVAVTIEFFSKKNINKNAVVKSKYQNYLLETFSGMRSLQYTGLQDIWFKNFKEVSASSSLYGKNALTIGSASEAIFDALTLLTGLATLVMGAVLIIDEQMQVGALIAILFVIWRLLAPIKTISIMLPKMMQIRKSIKQINELMRFPTEIPTERQWENTPSKILGDIHFDQVAFRYPGSETFALKNVSFSLKRGETLFILGPAGSGKSSIINLLLNLYPIQGGSIYIDQKNIKQFDVCTLRKNIAVAPQQTELFYGTIEQNLKLTQPLASRAQIVEAARAANLLEEVDQLPDGWDTRIRFYGDYRFGASFGQKMNLARAYLRNAPILILDEPTNGLDKKNINLFVNYLESIKDKTTIIITEHDAKCIHLADYVVMLQDGFVVKAGKPDEVLKNIPKGMI